MPEGPEVKKQSEYLNNFFKNNKINNINILNGRYTKKFPTGFKEIVYPLNIISVKTKGKFIYFLTKNHVSIWNTLGMSGYWSLKITKHANICFETDKGKIYFVDQRNFGTIKFCFDLKCLEKKLDQIGPDMLSINMNIELFNKRIKLKKNLKKKIAIVLLDQKVVSGIGNYLRSEILWFSKISPHRFVCTLTESEISILYKNAQKLIWLYYSISKAKKNKIVSENDVKKYNLKDGFMVYMQDYDINNRQIIREKLDNRTIHWVYDYQK